METSILQFKNPDLVKVKPLKATYQTRKGLLRKLLFLVTLFLMCALTTFAHSWEIRVAQNQNGTLTWWSQSYHTNNSCGIANSGIVINGVNYQFTTSGAGSIIPFATYVFTYSQTYYNICSPNPAFNPCGSRVSWASVTTPYIAGTLNVQVFSPNACFAPMPDMPAGNGAFNPPPPPVCTTCPVTGWNNTVDLPGNNNGTPCNPTDDFTTANISVNHLACASITGDQQFRVIFDPGGANVSYGPINYATGIVTNVTINIPYGTSNSTQVKVIDDDFPCEVQHGLSIPNGQYLGIGETILPIITCPPSFTVNTDNGVCGARVCYSSPVVTDNCSPATPAGYIFLTQFGNSFYYRSTAITDYFTAQTNAIAAGGHLAVITSAAENAALAATGVGFSYLGGNDVGSEGSFKWSNCEPYSYSNYCGGEPNGGTSENYLEFETGGCWNDINEFNNRYSILEIEGAKLQQTAGLPQNSLFPVGTTTNTFVATDASGNIATCSFTVTVTDNEAPSITCAAAQTQTADAGVCKAAVTVVGPATGDNCGVAGVTNSYNNTADASGTYPVGTTTVTWTVTDIHGNSSSCTQTITVTDNEKPVISVSPVLSCYAANNFGCSINLGVTATDNCAVQSLTSNAPPCFPVGTTTVTWTATDIHGNTSTATQLVTRNPEININICAGPTRTIYTGTTSNVGPFGPQSVNLTSTVTGGTPGYTYNWTPSTGLNNANIANPVASPAVTTTYTLKVTDSKGCSRTLSITINVSPLSSAVCSGSGNNVKFRVCHIPPGNPSNPQNICISVNALNAHLTSGSSGHNNCYLGPCDQLCYSTIPGALNFVQIKEALIENEEIPVLIEETKDAFKVNAFPNPSVQAFSLQVISGSSDPIRVRIMDMNGVVKSVSNVFSKANMIKVGANLPGGTYMAEVTQGQNKQVVKLVKFN